MALKKYPDCGYEMSKSALSCPKCGHITTSTRLKYLSIDIILFNIFIMLYLINLKL